MRHDGNLSRKVKNCYVIMPVFNDQLSCLVLINQIDKLTIDVDFTIIVVDDASTFCDPSYDEIREFKSTGKVKNIEILELEVNTGVNGAIYSGLSYAFSNANTKDIFIVMDSDGEDSPTDIEKMLANYEDHSIIVAKRHGYSRGIIFNLWRLLFMLVMKLTTNQIVNFGNFSLFDFNVCKKLLNSKNFRLSFVGAVLSSRMNLIRVPIRRSKRLTGKSVSGRLGQIQFGFRIMSCFIDIVLIRILKLSFFFLIMNFLGTLIIAYLKYTSNTVIPGWASLVLVILASSSIQLIFTLAMLILIYIHLQRLFLTTTENL
jgi:glycosyltransferase involved in cell wall biosynthesis